MSEKSRSANRIFGSKIVYPAVEGWVVEYDFGYSPKVSEEQVKEAVAKVAVQHGVPQSAIHVRTDHANGHTYVVVRLELDCTQVEAVTSLGSEPGWAQKHFIEKGFLVVGMRIEGRTRTSYAISPSRHRDPTEGYESHHGVVPMVRSAGGFNRDGRHYQLSDDGQSWVDTGEACCCC